MQHYINPQHHNIDSDMSIKAEIILCCAPWQSFHSWINHKLHQYNDHKDHKVRGRTCGGNPMLMKTIIFAQPFTAQLMEHDLISSLWRQQYLKALGSCFVIPQKAVLLQFPSTLYAPREKENCPCLHQLELCSILNSVILRWSSVKEPHAALQTHLSIPRRHPGVSHHE